jgi:hypothetical protein
MRRRGNASTNSSDTQLNLLLLIMLTLVDSGAARLSFIDQT